MESLPQDVAAGIAGDVQLTNLRDRVCSCEMASATVMLLSRETARRNTDSEIHRIAPEILGNSLAFCRESQGIQRNTGTLARGRGVLFTVG